MPLPSRMVSEWGRRSGLLHRTNRPYLTTTDGIETSNPENEILQSSKLEAGASACSPAILTSCSRVGRSYRPSTRKGNNTMMVRAKNTSGASMLLACALEQLESNDVLSLFPILGSIDGRLVKDERVTECSQRPSGTPSTKEPQALRHQSWRCDVSDENVRLPRYLFKQQSPWDAAPRYNTVLVSTGETLRINIKKRLEPGNTSLQ